jgi:CheY-like chemotaxis protein
MKSRSDIQTWDTRHRSNQLTFALVIEEAGYLRDSVLALLREHGWLVHAVSRAEQAFSILAHIPYNVIILDAQLPGMCATDFVRILRGSRGWKHVCLVVINDSGSVDLERQLADSDAFPVRRSIWEDDLVKFLAAYGGEFRMGKACG